MQESAASPLLHRAVYNSIFNGLGTISTFALGFVFAGLTIRYLGVSRAGYLLTLQAVIGLNALLGGFGLRTPSVRRLAVLHAQGDLVSACAVVGSVSTVNVATGLLFSFLIVIFFPTVFAWSRLDSIYQADAFWATLFVAGSFLLGQVASPWQAVYEATQRYDLMTALTTVFGLLSGTSGIVVLSVAPSMGAIAATGFAISIIRVICDAFFMQRFLERVPLPTWMWSEVRPMLGFGGWTYLSSLGGFLFTNMDRLILTTFLGSAAMPYYAVPQRLYSQIHTALSSQSAFLFPMLSAFGDRATAQIERLEDRLRWFVALVSGAAYTGLALVGPLILNRLVSPDFGKQATVPLVLACAQGFLHAQMIVPYFSSWAAGFGAPNAVAQLLNGTLVGVTAIWLIPHFGFVGASVAQLWIGVIAVMHTLWVRHMTSSQDHLWRWLRAYVSPCLMIVVWLWIWKMATQFVPSGSIMFYTLVLLGGVVGLSVVWLVERVVFPTEDRWTTLMRATEIPLRRIRRVVLAK
jgi:O-antigen/teichoic acid export membrane protein